MFKSTILTMLFLLTALSAAQPRGEFVAGKSDGEDFKFHLTFKKKNVFIKTFDRTPWHGETTLKKIGEDIYHFILPFPDEHQEVTLIQADEDSFILSSPKESEILRGHKLGSAKHKLGGTWNQADGDGSIIFRDSTIQLMNQESQLYPLKRKGPIYRAVLVKQNQPEDSILLNFVKTGQNTLLVWDEEDGDVRSFNRAR